MFNLLDKYRNTDIAKDLPKFAHTSHIYESGNHVTIRAHGCNSFRNVDATDLSRQTVEHCIKFKKSELVRTSTDYRTSFDPIK